MRAPPDSGLDPRTVHGCQGFHVRWFSERLHGAVRVPVLVLETPASPTPRPEQEQRTAAFGGTATVQRISDAEARTVLDAVRRWLA
jgi:hypothetical protein